MKNKNYKSKFIFINSNKVKRPTYIVKREFSFNDFDNVYYKTGEETLDSIFKLYEIPEKYRKIAIEVNSRWPLKTINEDYITKTKYDIIIKHDQAAKKKEDNIFVNGHTQSIYFYNRFYFKTFTSFVGYEEILKFYNKLKDEGIFKNYITAISDFYKINTISENIEKFNKIMKEYKNGIFGDKNLNLNEILALANEKDLLEKMNLYELHYLLDNSEDITKILFIEEVKNKLAKDIDSKVKRLNKNN